ncbi:hypothetical protein [Micromonospora sp. WMMD812]|uniref:hypothetical protein n=1 Tax=Micromonospora sp. WMMD812 TaxID=3015152 RepID=UPI00248B550B|nr:hypothetical protein [Micromonospora sp. WMMD812]WBB69127.1 hypothetical protein O7603_07200 [Micromonospora sp. WMMD812]
MTDRNHDGAPVPVGDVVPGDPPVPITVWPVPAPQRGETMSHAMASRLVHNLTHPSDLIIDLTQGPQLAHAITAARRRRHLLGARLMGWGSGVAMLIVTGWPLTRGAGAVEFFVRCRAKLLPGGCLAVLLGHGDPILPVDVVIAAKQACLSYLQHIVAADQPPTRGHRTQMDIHTDVLVFTRAEIPESSGKSTGSRYEPEGSSAQSRYRRSGSPR